MIEIVQTGQYSKTSLLFDMHRLRTRIFKDRMGWDVEVDRMGLEVDQFDIPEAVYFLALNEEKRVIGSWRLLPTTGPTMISDVWPEFLTSLPMPNTPFVWEASRFGVSSLKKTVREGLHQVGKATAELFCALTEACILCGISEVYTLYDARIARLIKRLDCNPQNISSFIDIDGNACQIGRFVTDETMLKRLHRATGIKENLISAENLPPILLALHELSRKNKTFPRELSHVS